MSRMHWAKSIPIGLGIALMGMTHAACTDVPAAPTGSSGNGGTGGTGGAGFGGDIVDFDDCGWSCQPVCSSDLTAVVNSCTDEVLWTCTADQACLNGACLDNPCAAAEADRGSAACDFWAVKTALRPAATDVCFVAFVTNSWAKNVHINVTYDGAALDPATFAFIPSIGAGGVVNYVPYDPALGLPPKESAILFLSQSPVPDAIDCAKPVAVNLDTGVSGTGIGKAFHITTDYPVTAHQMAPFTTAWGGASATLLLPTSAWGTNYVAVNAYEQVPETDPNNPFRGYPSLVILAKDEGTKVRLVPGVDIIGGPNVMPAQTNTIATHTLNAGEFLQITQPAELTGSPIEADKPIAVFGASTCMRVPATQADCDPAQQQLPPVNALGSEYVAVRHKSRDMTAEEPARWRLIGHTDDTMLTWVPAKPLGAPTSLKLGEVIEFEDPGPYIVQSQDANHPFYLGAYMTGGAPFGNIGDPEWTNVVPTQQYLQKYVFLTSPMYPETSLVVIRLRSKITKEFAPVNLACRGELTDWAALDNDTEWTRVDLVTGNFMNVETCTNGRQEMTSTAPFGVTVWGWGVTQQTLRTSYAYPAGAGFKVINEVVVPATPK